MEIQTALSIPLWDLETRNRLPVLEPLTDTQINELGLRLALLNGELDDYLRQFVSEQANA